MKLPIVSSDDACCRPRRLKAKDVVAFTSLMRALSDETRLQIVALLSSADGPVCVCDLETRFDLAQPTISHHLKVLREAGLVRAEKKGTWVYYEVDAARVDGLAQLHATLTGGARS